MTRASDVSEALATLQARWGAAAPRRGAGGPPGRDGDPGPATEGALALAPVAIPEPASGPAPDHLAPTPLAPVVTRRPGTPAPDADTDGRVVSTGFADLDGILGPGGLPRTATVALRGAASSGRTTVALRTAAEAQAGGAIVAWLDLARAFDPVEAVARGVRLEWLVVLAPADLDEALAIAGALLAARTVDLLVVDLPEGRDPAVAGRRVGDRLGRLAALARRAGALLVVLEPASLGRPLAAAVEEASGLRLELRRTGWIRLGRDVVGQRSAVEVARNRYGPPGRRATLEILYAEGGTRDACLDRPLLLDGLAAPAAPPGTGPVVAAVMPPPARAADLQGPPISTDSHAPAAPALVPPAPAPGEGTDGDPVERRHLRVVAARPDRPRRPTLDGRDRGGRGSPRPCARRAAGDAARERAPARARGDLPGPRA
jgi:RecA/RadA recombinase